MANVSTLLYRCAGRVDSAATRTAQAARVKPRPDGTALGLWRWVATRTRAGGVLLIEGERASCF
eukprot:scaffold3777_cov55-Phaeocystis_antarctica.AAC.2